MPSFTDPYAAAKHFAAAYGVDMERCLAAIRWEMDDIAREDEKDKRGSGRRRLDYHALSAEAAERMGRWLSPNGDPGTMLAANWPSLRSFIEMNRQARVWAVFASRAARSGRKGRK